MKKTGIVSLEGDKSAMPKAQKELEALLTSVRLCNGRVKTQLEWGKEGL
jgi:hypothetical protein